MVGGEDEESPTAFQDPIKLKSKSKTLRAKLSALLKIPIAEPAYQWAAAFGVTADGLPIIGPVPGLNNVYAVMGYGGNGITYSQIAAEIVSSAILGHQDPDSELFAFAEVARPRLGRGSPSQSSCDLSQQRRLLSGQGQQKAASSMEPFTAEPVLSVRLNRRPKRWTIPITCALILLN
ncbi:hypothetical protein D9M70_462680 [compost metagenome]